MLPTCCFPKEEGEHETGSIEDVFVMHVTILKDGSSSKSPWILGFDQFYHAHFRTEICIQQVDWETLSTNIFERFKETGISRELC